MKLKENLKRFWQFLQGDSLASWIVSLILVFLFVKFIFFPLLSLILQTKLPLVVVESESMHHSGSFFGNLFLTQNNFEKWWQERGGWYEERGIEKKDAEKWPFKTGFDEGDIIIVYGDENPEVGDVIIFNAEQRHPVIHRIVKIHDRTYSTKGDNNIDQIYFEKSISQDVLIGKAVFRIPKLGWIKLVFARVFGMS